MKTKESERACKGGKSGERDTCTVQRENTRARLRMEVNLERSDELDKLTKVRSGEPSWDVSLNESTTSVCMLVKAVHKNRLTSIPVTSRGRGVS